MCNIKPPPVRTLIRPCDPSQPERGWPRGLSGALSHQSNRTLFSEGQRIPERILHSLSICFGGFQIQRSNFVEFCNDQYSHHLVKWTTDAQTSLIWTPVQTWNGLSRQRNILQKADGTCNSHLYTLRIFLWSLNRVFAESKIKVYEEINLSICHLILTTHVLQ